MAVQIKTWVTDRLRRHWPERVVRSNYKEDSSRQRYRSIEHLHPQTPTDSKSDAWDEENLHRFGNLAMISAAFNSTQSNESAGVKMERIHHQVDTSQSQSLKMLHMWITYKDGET